MRDLLEFIIRGITGSDDFTTEEIDEGERADLLIKVNKDLVGLIIGKNGRTIRAIRNLLRVRATLEKKVVFVSVSEKD